MDRRKVCYSKLRIIIAIIIDNHYYDDACECIAYSFQGLVRYLFTLPDVKVFLSRKICQDPLEKFFGCQRQVGGTHDNPTVKEFQQNTQALRVVNSFCRERWQREIAVEISTTTMSLMKKTFVRYQKGFKSRAARK